MPSQILFAGAVRRDNKWMMLVDSFLSGFNLSMDERTIVVGREHFCELEHVRLSRIEL